MARECEIPKHQENPTAPATIATPPPARKAWRMKSYSSIVAMGIGIDQPDPETTTIRSFDAQYVDDVP